MATKTRRQYRLEWLHKRVRAEKREREGLLALGAASLSVDGKLTKIENEIKKV